MFNTQFRRQTKEPTAVTEMEQCLGTDLMKRGSGNTIQEAAHGSEDPWSTDLEGNGGDEGFGTRRGR